MLGITVNIFNPYTQEVEAEESQIQDQSRLHNEITSKKHGCVVRHRQSRRSGGTVTRVSSTKPVQDTQQVQDQPGLLKTVKTVSPNTTANMQRKKEVMEI